MPDMIAPVGAMVQPPNPQQGLGLLSSLIDLRQRQQTLQTGQYLQQTAQAQAQQAQQQNSELQALGRFTANAVKDALYRNSDGGLNVQKFQQDAAAVAPVYGQAYIGQFTANANGAVDNLNALLKLSNYQRATISNYFSSVAQMPGATTQDLLDAVEKARTVSDDPGYQRAVDTMLLHVPSTVPMPTDQASAAIRNYAGLAAQHVSEASTPGAGANGANPQGTSAVGPSAVPQAGAGSAPPGVTSPLSPQQLDQLRLTAQSAGNSANAPQYASYPGRDQQTHFAQVNPNAPGGIRQDLGTSLQPGMTLSERYSIQPGPNGQLMLTDRQGGRVTPLSGVSAAGSAAPGQGATVTPNTNAFQPIGRRGNAVLTAANDPNMPSPNAPTAAQQSWISNVAKAQKDVQDARDVDSTYGNGMATAYQIRQLSVSTNTGPGTPEFVRFVGAIGARLGVNNVADYQTLGAALDRQIANVRSSLGLPATNEGLATARVAAGDLTYQRDAINAKNDYYESLTELAHRYRTGLDRVEGFSGNASPTAVNQYKAAFTANANPIAQEYELAKSRGDIATMTKIASNLSPKQAQQMQRKISNMAYIEQGQLPPQ